MSGRCVLSWGLLLGLSQSVVMLIGSTVASRIWTVISQISSLPCEPLMKQLMIWHLKGGVITGAGEDRHTGSRVTTLQVVGSGRNAVIRGFIPQMFAKLGLGQPKLGNKNSILFL